jgi:hypothetical protein
MSKRRNKGSQSQKGSNGGQHPPTSEKCRFGDFPRVQGVQRIEPSTEDNQRYANEQRDRTTQIGLSSNLNWITGVAAGISLLALAALFVSLSISRTQADTSRRELDSSQRPWLTLKVNAEKLVINKEFAVIDPTTAFWTNTGHSVAQNVRYYPWLITNETQTGKECEKSGGTKGAAEREHVGTSSFPGEPTGMTLIAGETGTLQDDLKKSSTPGILTFRLIACIHYNYPLSEARHYTQVTYWVMHKGTQSADFTPEPGVFDIELVQDLNGTEAN